MKKKLMLAVPAVTGAMTALSPMMAYAAEAGSAASAATDAVGAVTAISSLFTTYPMNVFLGFGIAAAAIGLFARAKSASGGKKS